MDDQPDIQIGDIVRVGQGKKTWRVESLWPGYGETLARLAPTEGYTHTSAGVARLVLVERPDEPTIKEGI